MDGESEWQGGTRHRLWQPEGKRIIAFWSFWICVSGDVLMIPVKLWKEDRCLQDNPSLLQN